MKMVNNFNTKHRRSPRHSAGVVLHLIRWHKPAGTLLLIWPPLWCLFLLADTWPPLDIVAAFILGAFFMRSAGCVIIDMTDRKLDAQVERTKSRPLASGAISLTSAYVMLALLLLGALAVALYLGTQVLLAALICVPLVIAYPWMKRITFWPQLFLGITFNYGVFLASIALTGATQPSIWWLYLACIFWTLGYDTIYGFQDIKDDEKLGIKSTARLFAKRPNIAIFIIFFLSSLCLYQAVQLHGDISIWFGATLLYWPFAMAVQLYADAPPVCARLFRDNAYVYGGLILLFVGLHH